MPQVQAAGHELVHNVQSAQALAESASKSFDFIAFVRRLATCKLDSARQQSELQLAVRAAVEEMVAQLSADDIVTHSESLLDALQQSALQVTGTLHEVEQSLRALDLVSLKECDWCGHVQIRDAAWQKLAVLFQLLVAGLRAKLSELQRSHDNLRETDVELLPALEGFVNVKSAGADRPFEVNVQKLHASCAGNLQQVTTIAQRMAEANRQRSQALENDMAKCSTELNEAIAQCSSAQGIVASLTETEAGIDMMLKLEEEIKPAKKKATQLKRTREDLQEDGADDEDPALVEALKLETKASEAYQALLRRREGVEGRITELSIIRKAGSVHDDLEFAFPELPVRASRMHTPFKSCAIDQRGRARLHLRSLLQRSGLLVERSMKDYSKDVPLVITSTEHKHVKCRRLKGSAQNDLKALKTYSQDEYKRVQRAVRTAKRLDMPGIVPVECGFVDGDKVVIQMPYYRGGTLRSWSRGKNRQELMVAAHKLVHTLAQLHRHEVLHRSQKLLHCISATRSEPLLYTLATHWCV